MNAHQSEAQHQRLIQTQERVFAAQFRASQALEAVRAAAWDAGHRDDSESEREARFAADVTAAVADLVHLALGVEEVAS